MAVAGDKVFEDQIEKMKQKNQKILERFQAIEEDRKQAENAGAVINKKQNIQIRLRNDDTTKQRKNSNPPPLRPKSFHDGSYNADRGKIDYYNQYNESRKQGKFPKNNKIIDDDVAYQDYVHFQQTLRNKTDQTVQNNKSNYRSNNSHSYTNDNYSYTPSYRDYQRSMSQRNRTSPRVNATTFQDNKTVKVTDKSNNKFDNNKSVGKETVPKTGTLNPKNKSKTGTDNNQNIDPSNDKKPSLSSNKKGNLNEMYLDDNLEDMEKYRLKVDMNDFTVSDPESLDPILTKPLTSWTNDVIVSEPVTSNGHEECKQRESSTLADINVKDGVTDDISIVKAINKGNLDKGCEEKPIDSESTVIKEEENLLSKGD